MEGKTLRYFLRDDCTVACTAPLPATFPMSPGPGIWTPTDANNQISVAAGWAEFGSHATVHDLVCKNIPITRASGQIILCKWRCASDGTHYPLALVDSQTPAWGHINVIHGFYRSGALTLSSVDNALIGVPLMPFVADGTVYQLAIVLQATGAYYFAKGGTFTDWTFLRFSTVGTATPLYAAVAGYESVFSVTQIRAPKALYGGALVAGA
jgi:hypothetical protein